ncbi:tRNA pseudouridine(54/55) synthase Pus10, partial [Candidatus Acetothermia bacterium]
METQDMLELAKRIVRAGPICDECLGRAFARRGHGLTNRARGQALRTVLSMLGTEGKPGTCWVCGGLFDRVKDWAKRAASAASEYEFSTYLFGVKLTPRLAEMERFFQDRFPSDA